MSERTKWKEITAELINLLIVKQLVTQWNLKCLLFVQSFGIKLHLSKSICRFSIHSLRRFAQMTAIKKGKVWVKLL